MTEKGELGGSAMAENAEFFNTEFCFFLGTFAIKIHFQRCRLPKFGYKITTLSVGSNDVFEHLNLFATIFVQLGL